MRITEACIQVSPYTPINNCLLKQIEAAGRTCYRSEDSITDNSAEGFVSRMIKNGHEAMLEHADVSIRIICDRGVTHEIVRHRLASYAQESTRYCNYSKDKFGAEITYINLEPGLRLDKINYSPEQMDAIMKEWQGACSDAEMHYFNMLLLGASPQIARSVLNNSTRTEIVVKMNIREWRHFIKLRAATTAHPQMREVASQVLKMFRDNLPCVVADITD